VRSVKTISGLQFLRLRIGFFFFYAALFFFLKKKAKEILKRDNKRSVVISPSWSHKYIKRSPLLCKLHAKKLEKQRFSAMNYDNVFSFFTLIKYIWMKEGFVDDLVYNFDETGVNMAENRTDQVVCYSNDKYGYVETEERIKNVTIYFMVGCMGHSLPPAFYGLLQIPYMK
jgi:hypothetical protein